MNLLFDTNILLRLAKDDGYKIHQLINPNQRQIFSSVVSIAELKSIALQNKWGSKKWQAVDEVLRRIIILEINESLPDTYAEIDAYSQRRNPDYQDFPFATPRNMGKNDLWIAATAALLGLKLITTDGDFAHLKDVFIEVNQLMPKQLT